MTLTERRPDLASPDAPQPRRAGPPLRRRLHPDTERSGRRALTLLALTPLSVILAVKAANVVGDPFLNAYGIAVLFSTILVMYIAFVHYRDPAVDALADIDLDDRDTLAGWPSVSVMVAVKDEVQRIEECVESLVALRYDDLEVIVVDDGSTDGTVELLERMSANGAFRLLALRHNRGKKRALVEAARVARGEIFVFTDSDCIVAPDAVTRLVAAFRAHPEIGALSGHARASNANENLLTRVQDVWYDGQFGIAKSAESVFGAVTCVSGPLAAFRREAIYNYLPAWANDRFAGREFRFATDRQLTGYVLGQEWRGDGLKERYADDPMVRDVDHPAKRWQVGYVRSARAVTAVPSSMTAFLRQQVRWKKSFIRNLFFTGSFYWRRGRVAAAMFYGHIVWVALAPLMAFRHLVLLPMRGAAFVTFLYLCGVTLKGGIWGLAYRVQNPRDRRWVYRPLMSLTSALFLSWLLPYSLLTLRRANWARGSAPSRGRSAREWLLTGTSR